MNKIKEYFKSISPNLLYIDDYTDDKLIDMLISSHKRQRIIVSYYSSLWRNIRKNFIIFSLCLLFKVGDIKDE